MINIHTLSYGIVNKLPDLRPQKTTLSQTLRILFVIVGTHYTSKHNKNIRTININIIRKQKVNH